MRNLFNRLSKIPVSGYRRYYGVSIGLMGSFSTVSVRSCAGSCASCVSCGALLLLAAGIVVSEVAIKKSKG